MTNISEIVDVGANVRHTVIRLFGCAEFLTKCDLTLLIAYTDPNKLKHILKKGY